MFKPLSIAAAGLLAVTLLGGCGNNGGTASNAASTPPSSNAASDTPSASSQSNAGNSANTAPSDKSPAAPAPQPSGQSKPSKQAKPQEKPVAPEKNPLGDIPDTQAFVTYNSKAGAYSLDIPEGWARTEKGAAVSFINKLDGLKVDVIASDQAPTVASVKTGQAADLVKNGRAVKITAVKEVKLPSGKAIKVSFTSNSEPNGVTGKQIRQENEAYFYYKNKKIAVLTLWAPLGADNVDQWKRMSDSFKWSSK